VKVTQAYRYALDPTRDQVQALLSHCGAARFTFNWALATVKAALSQREAEKTYTIATEWLTEVPWNLYALRRAWNLAKDQVAPWWRENSKEAYNSGLDGVARALRNFSDSRSGRRAGKTVGFPRFKSKHRAVLSCRFTTGVIRIQTDRRQVTLPRLGTIRLHESARKLARRIQAGTARILSATVSVRGERWHVAFTVEIERAPRVPAHPGTVIGVDLGVTSLAVLSDGEVIANPKHHQAAQRRLRRCNKQLARRHGPRTSGGGRRPPSRRWHKARKALSKVHAHLAAQRRDSLHKLTTRLARTYGTIVAEDLHVAGMLRNRRLARAIADTGMAEIRRQLTYKTTWNGGKLILADRWYPSSKTCSACGTVKAKLALAERTFTCTACSRSLDRDLNAARNLAALAADVAQSCGETQNARRGAVSPGNNARHAPMKREPRPKHSSRGTLPPQGESYPDHAHIRARIG